MFLNKKLSTNKILHYIVTMLFIVATLLGAMFIASNFNNSNLNATSTIEDNIELNAGNGPTLSNDWKSIISNSNSSTIVKVFFEDNLTGYTGYTNLNKNASTDGTINVYGKDTDSDGLYEEYVLCSASTIYAPADSYGLFADLSNLQEVVFNNFNTSLVTSMSTMFGGCSSLKTIDVNSFNTAKVKNMGSMFNDCKELTKIDGLTNFSTVKVTKLNHMFNNCYKLKTLNLSSFNTSNVTDMKYMFAYCRSLTTLNLKSFDTSNVYYMGNMFDHCSMLSDLDISSFDTSIVVQMQYMFQECDKLVELNLTNFNTSSATNMSFMFSYCDSLNKLNLSSFTFESGVNVNSFIYQSSNIIEITAPTNKSTTLNYSNGFSYTFTPKIASDVSIELYNNFGIAPYTVFDITQLTSAHHGQVLLTGRSLANITFYVDGEEHEKYQFVAGETYTYSMPTNPEHTSKQFAGWSNTENSTTATWISGEKTATESVDWYVVWQITEAYFHQNWQTQTQKLITNSAITSIEFTKTQPSTTNLVVVDGVNNPIEVGSSSVTDTSTAYLDTVLAYVYTDGSITFYSAANINAPQSCKYLFSHPESGRLVSLTNITFDNFNTRNVTDMKSMFYVCSALTSLDLSNFDTSSVTNMDGMFNHCRGLTSLNLSNFDTSNVTNMDGMFYYCRGLTSLNISSFDTSSVTDMHSMFYNCSGLTSLNISNFDTSSVTDMSRMFTSCTKLTSLDLSNFDTSSVTNMNEMFHSCSGLTSLDISMFTIGSSTNVTDMFSGMTALNTLKTPKSIGRALTLPNSNFADTSLAVASRTLTNTVATTDNSKTFKYAYTLTANGNGGTLTADEKNNWTVASDNLTATKFVLFDEVISNFPNATRLGYTNNGNWNISQNGSGAQYTEDSQITEDTTLYIQWSSAQYTITYKDIRNAEFSGTHNSGYPTTHIYGTPTTLKSATKTGYSFDGWYIVSDCSGTSLTVLNATAYTQNIVLYAKWTIINYNITYNLNNGVVSVANPDTYNIETETFTLNNPTRNGHEFLGWTGTDLNSATETVTITKGSTGDREYTATWSRSNVYFNRSWQQQTQKLIANKAITNIEFTNELPSTENLVVVDGTSNPIAVGAIDLEDGGTYLDTVMAYVYADGTIIFYSEGYIYAPQYSDYLFSNSDYNNTLSNLANITFNNFYTSNSMYMSYMFYRCSSLTSLTLPETFNTSNVTTMQQMFSGCSSLTSLNLSKFDTSNVTNMGSMFAYCSKLRSLDISNFDTNQVAGDGQANIGLCDNGMYGMFDGCSGLSGTFGIDGTAIKIGANFRTDNVKNMGAMFSGCSGLTFIDLSTFNTSNVTRMSSMFSGCSGLVGTFGINGTAIKTGANFKTDNVEGMGSMYSGCSALTSLDLSNFNTSKATNMSKMFEKCSALTDLDIRNFDTKNVSGLGQIGNVNGMYGMFYGCSKLNNLILSELFDTTKEINMGYMFYKCSSLTSLTLPSTFNTSNVTNMSYMFSGCSKLTTLDISMFTVSNSTNVSSMFSGMSGLKTLKTPSSIGVALTLPSANFVDISLSVNERTLTSTVATTDNNKTFKYAYTLTANANGGILSADTNNYWTIASDNLTATKIVLFDETITSFPVATRTSYALTAWNTSSIGTGTEYTTASNITAATTVYAQWTIKEYVVTVSYGKGISEIAYSTTHDGEYTKIEDGKNATLVADITYYFKAAASEGYTFSGWSGWFTNTNNPASKSESGVVDRNLVASAMANTYTITYNLDGGTTTTANKATYTVETETFTIINPTKTDFAFAGWTGTDLNGATISVSIKKGSIGDRNYTATWTATRVYFHRYWQDKTSQHLTNDKITSIAFVSETPSTENLLTSPVNVGALSSTNYGTTYTNSVLAYIYNDNSIKFYAPVPIYAPYNSGYLFSSKNGTKLTGLTEITFDNFYTSSVGGSEFMYNGMYGMFSGCSSLKSIIFPNSFDTSNVEEFSHMFSNCSSLESITFGVNFKTDNATTLAAMFSNCQKLSAINLSNFNTSKVEDMYNMFGICKLLTSITFPDTFDTLKVEDMSLMFIGCSALETIDFGAAFNTSNVKTLEKMFYGCTALKTFTSFENFYTANVTNFSGMFIGCAALENINLGNNFSTIKAENISSMFNGCSALKTVNLENFNTSTVKDFSAMFLNCTALEELTFPNTFVTSNATKMINMFANCLSIQNLNISNFVITENVDVMNMLGGMETLSTIKTPQSISKELVLPSINFVNTSLPIGERILTNTITTTDGNKIFKYGYTLTANANGGALSADVSGHWTIAGDNLTATKIILFDEVISNFPIVERIGNSFEGWFADDVEYTTTSNITQTTTIFAQWNIITYTINYNLNNGAVNSTNPTEYTVETDTFTLINPTRDGYDFAGWTGTDLDNLTTTITIAKGTTGNREYTANWSIVTYSISYQLNGGTVNGANPTEYTVETDTFTLINPSKDGYTFVGWTSTELDNETLEVVIEKGSVGNRSYIANWSVQNVGYTVKHYKEMLDGTYTSFLIEGIEADTDEIAVAEYVTEKGFSPNITHPETVNNQVVLGDGSLVLQLYYSRNSYTVTLDKTDGIESVLGAGTYKYEEEIIITATVKTGYNWIGWTGSAVIDETSKSIIIPGEDLRYTATAQIITYTISYELNNGTVNGVNPTEYTVETDTFTLINPTRDGYDFAGWTGSNGTEARLNVTVNKGSTGDLNYTANWSGKEYTINYEVDVVHTNPGSYVVQEQLQNINLNVPVKNGYVFEEWVIKFNTQGDFATISNNVLTIPANSYGSITLVAKWSALENIITYVLYGGTNSSNTTKYETKNVNQTITINNPSKNGFSFDGWIITSNSLGAESSILNNTLTIPANAYGNITLSAIWSGKTYNIIYSLNGGSIDNNIETSYITSSSEQTIEILSPTKVGYSFTKWIITSNINGEQAILNDNMLIIPANSYGDMVLTAEWQEETIAIIANKNVSNLTYGYETTEKLVITASGGGNLWVYSIETAYPSYFELETLTQTNTANKLIFKLGADAGIYSCTVKAKSVYTNTYATVNIFVMVAQAENTLQTVNEDELYVLSTIDLLNYISSYNGALSFNLKNDNTTNSIINNTTLNVGTLSATNDDDGQLQIEVSAGDKNYKNATKTITLKVKKYDTILTWSNNISTTLKLGESGNVSATAYCNSINAQVGIVTYLTEQNDIISVNSATGQITPITSGSAVIKAIVSSTTTAKTAEITTTINIIVQGTITIISNYNNADSFAMGFVKITYGSKAWNFMLIRNKTIVLTDMLEGSYQIEVSASANHNASVNNESFAINSNNPTRAITVYVEKQASQVLYHGATNAYINQAMLIDDTEQNIQAEVEELAITEEFAELNKTIDTNIEETNNNNNQIDLYVNEQIKVETYKQKIIRTDNIDKQKRKEYFNNDIIYQLKKEYYYNKKQL